MEHSQIRRDRDVASVFPVNFHRNLLKTVRTNMMIHVIHTNTSNVPFTVIRKESLCPSDLCMRFYWLAYGISCSRQ